MFSGLQSFLQVFTATLTRSPFCKERQGQLDPAPPGGVKEVGRDGGGGGAQHTHRVGVGALVHLSEEAFPQDPAQRDVLAADPVVLH